MARFWNKQKYIKLGRLLCDIGAVICWVLTLFPLLVYLMGKAKGQEVGYVYRFTVNPALILAVGFTLADFVYGYFLLKAQQPKEKKPRSHRKRGRKK